MPRLEDAIFAVARLIFNPQAWRSRARRMAITMLYMLGLGRRWLLVVLLVALSPFLLWLIIARTAVGRALDARAGLSRMRSALHGPPVAAAVRTLVR